MSTTTSDLLNRANIIKNETLEGKNSAVRVGSLFWDIISKMEGNTSKLSTLEELINSGGSRYSNVRVTPVYTNGVLIATIRVGVQDYAIYAPGKGGSGSDSDSDGYDDRELRREIDLIKSNLDNILEREKAGIKDMVEEILAGKNFINGWQEGWNEILQSYLIKVGVLGPDGVSKGWAYLETKYNNLEAVVNRLNAKTSDHDGTFETLQAKLDLLVQQDGDLWEAISTLSSRYALTDADQRVLQWLTAQLRLLANENTSLAELFAAAEDLRTAQNAIAALRTSVEQLDGKFVAKASLTSQVSNALGQLYSSGLLTKATLGKAIATLFAEGNDPNFGTVKSTIELWVDQGVSGITANADLLRLISQKLITETSLLQLVADNIVIDADDIDLEFKDFRMKDENGRLYIHSVKDSENRIIKFAYEVGEFDINEATGDINATGLCQRYSYTNWYLDSPKIVASQIMFPTQKSDGPSYLDFNQNSVIRWFDYVGNPETASLQTGDEYGFYRDGNRVEYLGTNDRDGEHHPSYGGCTTGYITFNGNTITIYGNVHVKGTVTNDNNNSLPAHN